MDDIYGGANAPMPAAYLKEHEGMLGRVRQPSTRERLQMRINEGKRIIKEAEEALLLLDRNPDFERLSDLMRSL